MARLQPRPAPCNARSQGAFLAREALLAPPDPVLAGIEASAVANLGSIVGAEVFRVALAIAAHFTTKAGEENDPWIDHTRWTFCTSRRAACELARSGAIVGARLVGAGKARRWIARRSAIDAYVEVHARPVAHRDVKPANDSSAEDVNALMVEIRSAPVRVARGGRR